MAWKLVVIVGLEPLFLVDGDFEGIEPFDTGLIGKRCTNLSPWGSSGWGVNAGTFLRADEDHALEGARLRVFRDGDNQVAGIFAEESRGIKMGFARFVQGDAWGGASCADAAGSDGSRIGWDRAVRESLSITQVEFLIEVMDGQGSVLFDNVHLVEVPEGVSIQDVSMPLPAPEGADPLPVAARASRRAP